MNEYIIPIRIELTIVPLVDKTETKKVLGEETTKRKPRYANRYQKWTKEDDAVLREMDKTGLTNKKMAKSLGRPLGAINTRLWRMKKGII